MKAIKNQLDKRMKEKNKRGVGNPTWIRDSRETKLIKKYADQWCKDNGYPIKNEME